MLLNHQRFFSGPVHFARWASVTAAELCSFAGDHHTTSFCRRRRLLLRLNQSTDNQGGEVINQPTGRRITRVWSVLNQGKSAIIGTNFTDSTLPVWPLTGIQSSHTCDSTYEHFNCRDGQKSCKNNPQSHMRKYCSEEGKWWKTKLPLNQHLPCESTYVRASIWPKSNTPTYCRIRLQTVASKHRYPANRCTPHPETRWANQSVSASCWGWLCVHGFCSSWGRRTLLHYYHHHLSYKSSLFSHLDASDLTSAVTWTPVGPYPENVTAFTTNRELQHDALLVAIVLLVQDLLLAIIQEMKMHHHKDNSQQQRVRLHSQMHG